MAIRWADIPHQEIFTDIYTRIRQNAAERSGNDSLKHILRRRLRFLRRDEHRQFIQLESSDLVERLRCTRDAYRVFTDAHECNPATEAYWVVLRFAVLPTAIASLKNSAVNYVRLSRVTAVDLSMLFGISTNACHLPNLRGASGKLDFDDRSPATDSEIQSLSALVNEDTLLWLEGHRYGHPHGSGPFAADDADSAHHSWGLCGLRGGVTLTDWMRIREKIWHACKPWTEGLSTLFECVQEELLSQCEALHSDGIVRELHRSRESAELPNVTVPEPINEFVKKGDVWTITFKGTTARVPANTIGFDYISVILRNGTKPISALQVQQLAGGVPFSSHFIDNARRSLKPANTEDDNGESNLGSSPQQQDFTRDEILDEVGRKKLRERQDDLERQTVVALSGKDLAAAERLQNEYDRIERELELSHNIHRRSRVFSTENERARVSVTQALTRAYRKIEKQSPELANHLKSEIATGSELWYRNSSYEWKC